MRRKTWEEVSIGMREIKLKIATLQTWRESRILLTVNLR